MPRELGNIPADDLREPSIALVPRSVSAGGMRAGALDGALRSPVDFFLPTTRDMRRWILDSKILFCCTVRWGD